MHPMARLPQLTLSKARALYLKGQRVGRKSHRHADVFFAGRHVDVTPVFVVGRRYPERGGQVHGRRDESAPQLQSC